MKFKIIIGALAFISANALGAPTNDIGVSVNSQSGYAAVDIFCNDTIILHASKYASMYANYAMVAPYLNDGKRATCQIQVNGMDPNGGAMQIAGGTIDIDGDPVHQKVSYSHPNFYNPINGLYWRSGDPDYGPVEPTTGSLAEAQTNPDARVITYTDNTIGGS
jgi:hypothetical protein